MANAFAPLLPADQVDRLIVAPVMSASIAAAVCTQITTDREKINLPVQTADGDAQWIREGQEMTPTLPEFTELTVTPGKIAGLRVISRETANDSTPGARDILAQDLQRSLLRGLDAAFFGTIADPAPSGLPSVAGVGTIDAGAKWTNIDPFIEATSAAAVHGSTITAFVANPTDELALAKLKKLTTGSNEMLLEVVPRPGDAAGAPVRTIAGVPLLTTTAVSPGTVWAVPAASAYMIVREGATVEADESVFFLSQRVAIAATMRVGFGFPDPAGIQKITLSAAAEG